MIISNKVAGLNTKRDNPLLTRVTFYMMNVVQKKYRLVK